MGFNFGAFAAGAVKGAGDLMEKQNKETRDTIDSNMKFAYQSGLPFVRERQKRLRSLTGQANDLANLGLTPDEVNAVMGQSDKQIQEFIDGSIKEKKMNTEFDPASQINMQEGGTITPWQDVQMGTIDTPSLNTPKPVARKSIFSSLMGSDDSGSDAGFERLRGKAEQEMSSITGVGYKDVIAASQGAYNYGERSDATINLVDSSLSASARMQQINLEIAEKLGTKGVDAQLFAFSRAKIGAEREDKRAIIQDKINEIDLMTLKFKIDNDMPQKELENELSEIKQAQLGYKFGTDSYDGLFITSRAIMIEQLKDDPNQEKLNALYDTRSFLEQTIAEQSALKKDSSAEVSFVQYNSVFESNAERILQNYVGEDKYFTYIDGVGTFDYSKMNAKEYEKYARQQAGVNWIDNMRATGQAVSQQMTNWMGLDKKLFGGSAQELATLPMFTTSSNNADNTDPNARYVFKRLAPPPVAGAIRKGEVWEIPASGDVAIIQVPVVRVYGISTGAKLLEGKALAEQGVVDQNAAAAQQALDSDEAALVAKENASQESFASTSNQQPLTLQQQRRKDADRETKASRRTFELAAETKQSYIDIAAENFKDATDDQKRQMNTIQNTLTSNNNMKPANRKAMLEQLEMFGTNWMHIKFAKEELAKLSQLEES